MLEIPRNATITHIDGNYEENGLTGLLINTNKGDIKLMISDYQCCCEDYEALFLETPDDISKYIGATILSIEDICIESDKGSQCGLDAGGETQLKITTNRGVLQYAVYNSHNGYYDHATLMQVFNFIKEGEL